MARKKRAKPMLPEQIRKLRKKLKLTQDKLGEKIGVSQRQVASWESGEREPSGPALILLHLLKEKTEKVD